MPAVFPNSVRVYTAKADLVDTVLAEHVNLLQDEVTAVQNTLGTSLLVSAWTGTFSTPSTHTSVSARFANIEAGLLGVAYLDSPAFTGTPSAPTAAADTSTTQLATTAFVTGQAGTSTPLTAGTATAGTSKKFARADHRHGTDTSRAPLASPSLTGTPTAPTASVGTNTTQIATTAFVNAEIANDAPTKSGSGASGTWGISVTGNAATATKLSTARTITLAGDISGSAVFDGASNITITTTHAEMTPFVGAFLMAGL